MQARSRPAPTASPLTEAELREREQRLQLSLEAARVGTWDWNIRTGDVRWSDSLERIHGQEPGAFRGTFEGFLESVHSDDRPRVLAAIQGAQSAATAYEIEYRSLCPDGTIRWFEGRGRVIPNAAGEPAWMSGICMDTTDRHRFEDQLRQTQRLESLGLLAGGIAHDFNNLLACILGNASLALNAQPPSSAAIPMLHDVISAGERAAQLTRRLLAYAGKDHTSASPIELTALVRDLSSLLRASIPKIAHLSLDLDDRLPPVMGDQAQLQQVIMNLVINAAEAIPERAPGEVTVSTRRRPLHPDDHRDGVVLIREAANDYIELSVRDTGSGMDQATQARIFDPFYTTKFTGRGLGLSAVLGIVRGHAGTIRLHSTPGEGTCVTILLPALPVTPESRDAEAAPCAEQGSGTILVVDDEPALREMVQRALESNGYRVLLAADGRAGIREVEEHPEIRAVLLDFAMPEMGGDMSAHLIRQLRPDLPILMSSGYAEHDATHASGDYSAFLQKPYTAAVLLDKLSRILSGEAN